MGSPEKERQEDRQIYGWMDGWIDINHRELAQMIEEADKSQDLSQQAKDLGDPLV